MSAGRCRSGKYSCNQSVARGKGRLPIATCVLAIIRALANVGIVVVFVSGCSDGKPHRVPVSGQVLIDGKPLTFGDLQFVPEGARPSFGKLDSNGHFTLTCYDGNDGVVPGLHRVAISGSEITKEQTVWHAPIKYANFRTSGISVQIDGATDSLVIEIGSDGRPAKVRTDKP